MPSTPRSNPGVGARGSTGRPPWCPTWPITGSSGCSWRSARGAARDRTGGGRSSPWAAPASRRCWSDQAAKAAFERQRPEEQLEARVRTPTSSSFPSGHTLAAFCTAFVLSETKAETVGYVGFAAAVAGSRVHLRAHHPTDVIGGAAIGSVLGLTLRPVVRLVTPGRRGAGTGWTRQEGNGTPGLPVGETVKPFAVTWDYRCPFAPQRPRAHPDRAGRRGRLGGDLPAVLAHAEPRPRRGDPGVGRPRQGA